MRKTKIVATIGPKTNSPESILSLINAGMDVARLNGSHGDTEWHIHTIATLRKTAPHIPILLDVPGRKIRIEKLGDRKSFCAGDTVIFSSTSNANHSANVQVNVPNLHELLSPKDTILADDGSQHFTVTAIQGTDVISTADTTGTFRDRMGIHFPNACLNLPLISERDRQMLELAREHQVDFVGISFVESADHVRAVREIIGADHPFIVSKIENQKGLDNLMEILRETHAAMIDRGDLSVETNLEQLPLFQNRILKAAVEIGKPVIVATEMLHSMIEKEFPTKAEVTDISNAVMNGASALMLSGETAIGTNPVSAVRTMRKVADTTASHMQEVLDTDSLSTTAVPQAVEDAIALICRQLPVTKIIAVTTTGYAARMLSARNPRQPIIAVSNSQTVARALNLLQGTEGLHVEVPFSNTSTEHFFLCLKELWQKQKLEGEDLILITGVAYPKKGNLMNMIQIHKVADLCKLFSWSR